jgi:hypothetical protein
MRIAAGLVVAALLTSPALAQTPATAPAATAKAPAFSADTPLEAVVAAPAAKAVLDTDLPGVSAHPAFDQFKAMSARQLQPYAQGKITDEQLAKLDTDLKALPAK